MSAIHRTGGATAAVFKFAGVWGWHCSVCTQVDWPHPNQAYAFQCFRVHVLRCGVGGEDVELVHI